MKAMGTVISERRRFARVSAPRVDINLLQPRVPAGVSSINASEGGLCLRIKKALEVRSLVRLQVAPEGHSTWPGSGDKKPVECAGRVAWVIQRLDLRNMPPFLFDVGIEFVNPPRVLRHLLAQRSYQTQGPSRRPSHARSLRPYVVGDRTFMPTLGREAGQPPSWHLVISADGAPCFSGHYPSEQTALAQWERFKRKQGRQQGGSRAG